MYYYAKNKDLTISAKKLLQPDYWLSPHKQRKKHHVNILSGKRYNYVFVILASIQNKQENKIAGNYLTIIMKYIREGKNECGGGMKLAWICTLLQCIAQFWYLIKFTII